MDTKITEIMGICGKMISASKGRYRYDNPKNLVIFNANVCTVKDGKIWHGDFDVTVDGDLLSELSHELEQAVYLLTEMDARFENEKKPLFENAVVIADGEDLVLGKNYNDFYEVKRGRFVKKNIVKPLIEEPERFNGTYNKSDYSFQLRIKEGFDFFKSNNKKNSESPFERFFSTVKKQLKLPVETILDPSKIVISKENYDILVLLTEEWMSKVHKLKGYDLQKNLSWYVFNISPSIFFGSRKGPDWADDNSIYVKKDFVMEENK